MNKIPYNSFSSFILRTPLLSFDYYISLFGSKHTDIEILKKELSSPVMQEAIFLASPDLYTEMQKWIKGEVSKQKEIDKLIYSLTKYILRMSSRCTPFGLFSGCSVVNIAGETNIEISGLNNCQRHTRLDMNYLCALAHDLSKMPVIRERIKFYPNSSLYKSGDNLRYVEYRYTNAKREHFVVSVNQSEYLGTILSLAAKGALLSEMANSIVSEEITMDDATLFIEELIKSQVIVSELEPAITGPEFLKQIKNVLNNIPEAKGLDTTLQSILNDLKNIDKSAPGADIANYYKLADKIKSLDTKYELKFLFQTDMNKPLKSNDLGQDVIDDILGGFEILNRLSPYSENGNLTKFKEAFLERYEEKEAPFLDVLDIESGIGYGQNLNNSGDVSPLVDDIILPGQQNDMQINWNKRESFLLKKYNEILSMGAMEMELTNDELSDFELNWNNLAGTIYTMAQIVESKSSNNRKEKIYLGGVGGNRASNLFGRFCHTDENIHKNVQALIQKEEESDPDSVFAEIIHLPESRTGNILLRPVLRKYEIPYLAKAYVNEKYQIKLEDLTLAVRNNKIVLRSKKLNKEVKPCLTTAHNFSFNQLPIYYFLCDLQSQNIRPGMYFSWGALSEEYDFLPRVTCKNLIFSLASWKVKKEEFKKIQEITDDNKLYKEIQKWRKIRNIPQYISLSDADNELILNLHNTLCIKTLLSVVKNRNAFQLKEFIFDPKNLFVKSNEGNFTNEFIFTFYKTQTNS